MSGYIRAVDCDQFVIIIYYVTSEGKEGVHCIVLD